MCCCTLHWPVYPDPHYYPIFPCLVITTSSETIRIYGKVLGSLLLLFFCHNRHLLLTLSCHSYLNAYSLVSTNNFEGPSYIFDWITLNWWVSSADLLLLLILNFQLFMAVLEKTIANTMKMIFNSWQSLSFSSLALYIEKACFDKSPVIS